MCQVCLRLLGTRGHEDKSTFESHLLVETAMITDVVVLAVRSLKSQWPLFFFS